MGNRACERCGSTALTAGYISLRCPICGERYYVTGTDARLMWSEHRTGLMYARGGWLWTYIVDPPKWFLKEVV